MAATSIVVSTNPALNKALATIKNKFIAAAQSELDANPSKDEYSITEQRSMVLIRALQLTKVLNLADMVTRVELWNQIEAENVVGNHPEGYTSMNDMANKIGMSAPVISRQRDIVNVVFPWIRERFKQKHFLKVAQEVMMEFEIDPATVTADWLGEQVDGETEVGRRIVQGLDDLSQSAVAQWWEATEMGRVVEVLPYLKVLITGETSTSPNVNTVVQEMIDNAVVTRRATGQNGGRIREAEAREVVADHMVDDMLQNTVQEIRREIRQVTGNHHVMSGTLIRRGDTNLLMMNLDDSEWRIIQNTLLNPGHAEITDVVIPDNADQAAAEMARIAEVRLIAEILRGE